MFLPISILAYALNAGAIIIDKILLTRALPNPAVYAFYISILGLLALVMLPFGFQWQGSILLPALLSGAASTLALLTFFKALKLGEASVAGPLVGALNPLFALVLGMLFFNQLVSSSQFLAMLVLLLGAGILTFNVWFKKIKTNQQLVMMVASGFFFALSYVFLKEVFATSNFITGLVLSRVFGALFALTFLLLPDIRKQILAPKVKPKVSLLLILGQSMGAAQGFLLAFATSLASPALVNSLFGVQYLIILGASFFINLNENLSKKALVQKILGAVILSLGVYLLSLGSQQINRPLAYGVSFSPRYAAELGLNPRLTYQSILTELSTKSVRLSAHWDEIELQQDQYNFQELDWYIEEAGKHKAKVILAIGYKLPRWPECRKPRWLDNPQEGQLKMLKEVIKHYEQNPAIWAWQLENEPLLNYGVCPPPDRQFLQKEADFVRGLTQKPVIITDSGELRPWITPAILSDILGITLYRTVETPLFGTFHYPLPALFYQFKANLVKILAGQDKRIIIVELQAEPWAREPLINVPLEDQIKRFPVSQMQKNVDFAQEVGFEEAYLWGVEWWYFMAANGYPEYLNYAKELFRHF